MELSDKGSLLDLLLIGGGLAVCGVALSLRIMRIFTPADQSHPGLRRYGSDNDIQRWQGLSAGHLLLVLVVYVSAVGLGGVVLEALGQSRSDSTAFVSLLADGLGKCIATVAMIYVANNVLGDWRHTWPITFARLGRQLIRAAGCYLAVYPLVNVLILNLCIYLVFGVLGWQHQQQHPALELLVTGRLQPWQVSYLAFLAVFITPVAEELFFRGLLQNYILGLSRSPVLAVLTSSLAFGIVHWPRIEQIVPLAVFGVVLGWWYWRNNNLLQAVLVHMIFNGVTLILLWLGFAG